MLFYIPKNLNIIQLSNSEVIEMLYLHKKYMMFDNYRIISCEQIKRVELTINKKILYCFLI